jgi:hypothetical protein
MTCSSEAAGKACSSNVRSGSVLTLAMVPGGPNPAATLGLGRMWRNW